MGKGSIQESHQDQREEIK